jgi:hypothetical protein
MPDNEPPVASVSGGAGTGTCLATGDASAPAAIDGLPAGSYVVIVTASPYSAPGSCGSFMLRNETAAADTIHADGFD